MVLDIVERLGALESGNDALEGGGRMYWRGWIREGSDRGVDSRLRGYTRIRHGGSRSSWARVGDDELDGIVVDAVRCTMLGVLGVKEELGAEVACGCSVRSTTTVSD